MHNFSIAVSTAVDLQRSGRKSRKKVFLWLGLFNFLDMFSKIDRHVLIAHAQLSTHAFKKQVSLIRLFY